MSKLNELSHTKLGRKHAKGLYNVEVNNAKDTRETHRMAIYRQHNSLIRNEQAKRRSLISFGKFTLFVYKSLIIDVENVQIIPFDSGIKRRNLL